MAVMKLTGLVAGLSALVLGVVPFTSVPPSDATPSASARAGWLAARVTVPSMVTITEQPTLLNVGQQQHSAFPGITRTPGGDIELVWRQGSDHYAARDGKIMRAVSHDDGQTYGEVVTLRSGGDYRDPSLAVIDNVRYLTFFTGGASNPAQGAWGMREWGAAARFDGGLPYAATAAPLVKLPNGQIAGAFYGRKAGEPAIDTAFMAWFGATVTTNRIANGIGTGTHHNESYLVVDGSLTHFFYRWGNEDGIGVRTSTNSGLPLASGASSWDAPRKLLNNASGRPTVVRAADGTLVMVYREVSTGAARIAYSTDNAQTFAVGPTLLPSMGGLGMTYASMVVSGDEIVGVLGMEQGGSVVSKLYGFRLDTTP